MVTSRPDIGCLLELLDLGFKRAQSACEHLSVIWVRGAFELFLCAGSGESQRLEPFATDTRGGRRVRLGRGSFPGLVRGLLLLLGYRFAFPASGHISHHCAVRNQRVLGHDNNAVANVVAAVLAVGVLYASFV